MPITPLRVLPLLGMMATIFVVSAQPGDQLHLPAVQNIDKLCHLLEYAVLATTALFSCHPIPKRHRTAVALAVVCFAALYGISDEFHQSFVPRRSSSVSDIIADTLGASLVAWGWWWRAGKGRAPQ